MYHAFYKGEGVILTIYVDDIIIVSAKVIYINDIKGKFCKNFDMTDMGELEN